MGLKHAEAIWNSASELQKLLHDIQQILPSGMYVSLTFSGRDGSLAQPLFLLTWALNGDCQSRVVGVTSPTQLMAFIQAAGRLRSLQSTDLAQAVTWEEFDREVRSLVETLTTNQQVSSQS